MEAHSLTDLNNLASNPPQYPVNPAETKQEPLVLYISRVPGTRDVILSPFKPQLKNVTGEDVASSLYYVHLEAPSGPLPPPHGLSDDEPRSSSDGSPTVRSIPRKPLPGSAKPLTPATPGSRDAPLSALSRASDEQDDPWKPCRGGADDASRGSTDGRPRVSFEDMTPEPKTLVVPTLQHPMLRKPMGPRADAPIDPHAPTSNPSPSLEPGPYQGRERLTTNAPRASTSRSPSPKKALDPNAFTLALIRRDPSTGNQWNVGKVSSLQSELPPVDQPEEGPLFAPVPPMANQSLPSANPPINIQIETLGYGKFRKMPMRKSFDAGPGEGLESQAGLAPLPRSRDGVTLQRQVVMGYGKSWSTNFQEKFNKGRQDRAASRSEAAAGEDGQPPLPPRPSSSSARPRAGSVGSDASVGDEMQTVLGTPGPGMRPRGYVFTSPWNGRCEFRTGTTGRSLRCYHVLRDERPPTVPLGEQNVPVPVPLHLQGGVMALSELRFNLPSVDLFRSAEGREEVKNQLQGHFNKLLKRDQGQGDADDGLVSPFDKNLGREKAGGGNRGKRAKLGKLIIYNDGLKMLDLVVAANMGVWWGAWEKSF